MREVSGIKKKSNDVGKRATKGYRPFFFSIPLGW